MHKYTIYDENFKDGFKSEWFAPKTVEDFYEKNQKSCIFEAEKKYFDAFKAFANTSFCICESEKYREYYGINVMKEIYPEEYPSELSEFYENFEENTEYPVEKAENVFKLMFRNHIWCILKFSDGTEIFFERPGVLTVLTNKKHNECIKDLEITVETEEMKK